jgi:hypothetical protein
MNGGVNLRGVLLAFVLGAGLLLAFALRGRGQDAGNRLVVLNASAEPIDSITVEPEPPGANLLAARAGALAAMDSVWLALPRARGDVDVRAFRGGRAIANHAVYFGGNSVFELRLGDRAQLGRYRRTGG